MKIFGGLIVVLYALVSITGWSPFGSSGLERDKLPPDARRGPGGVLVWHSGFHGGK